MQELRIYFSDFFDVSRQTIKDYGAFDVSLINDLPMFIDPFLLFNSDNPEYQALHHEMIKYLKFLRDKSIGSALDEGRMRAWYVFKEVKQNWLGFSLSGNRGHGLAKTFAIALHENFNTAFKDFGEEDIPESPHFEKLTLFDEGVGRDNVSDFTTNLIKKFLLEYTQDFARQHIDPALTKNFAVGRAYFNYNTETWVSKTYRLPTFFDDFVLLTPQDLLTKDDLWINQRDLVGDYAEIVDSIPNVQLRSQINNYFGHELSIILERKEKKRKEALARKRSKKPIRFLRPLEPSEADRKQVKWKAIKKFPQIIDYYLALKEKHGDEAVQLSKENVTQIRTEFVEHVERLVALLKEHSDFYLEPADSYDAALKRALYLKDVIEHNDGWRIFYVNGQPITREKDVHIFYRLTWFASAFDVNSEANSGRGPVDFAISRGSANKALVEFKLASNSGLANNLEHQTKIYQRAHRTDKSVKVIIYYNEDELTKVKSVLRQLELEDDQSIVLIDARNDNKQSASKVKSPKTVAKPDAKSD
jgi:hypothetical protein